MCPPLEGRAMHPRLDHGTKPIAIRWCNSQGADWRSTNPPSPQSALLPGISDFADHIDCKICACVWNRNRTYFAESSRRERFMTMTVIERRASQPETPVRDLQICYSRLHGRSLHTSCPLPQHERNQGCGHAPRARGQADASRRRVQVPPPSEGPSWSPRYCLSITSQGHLHSRMLLASPSRLPLCLHANDERGFLAGEAVAARSPA
jgi:hypothetical protein